MTTKEFNFQWRHPANDVIVTGEFDNWSKSLKLINEDFIHSVKVEIDSQKKQLFKFVVDGVWRCSLDFETEIDEIGNYNNVIYPDNMRFE